MMKLKTNKNFIKGLRTKNKNQKNKDRSWNLNKYKDNSESLNGQCEIQGDEREKRRESIDEDKSSYHYCHASSHHEEGKVLILTTRCKGIFGHQETTCAPPNTASTSQTMLHALQAPTTFFNNVFIFIKMSNYPSINLIITKKSFWKYKKAFGH
jgi:hypothetical protein